jgi:predicted amidohydrolase
VTVLAVATYAPEPHATWAALAAKLDDWVARAAGEGAELLVFPEYASEAGLVGDCPWGATPASWAAHMARVADAFLDLNREVAARHGVHLLTASGVARAGDRLVNRAHLIAPSGAVGTQDKIIPTPYERDGMGIVGGDALRLFETALGRIGVLICYDSEFPLLARQLAEAGADLLLVPSATELPAGQTRVRQSARARAIENQCAVAQAPLIGRLGSCDPLDGGTGRAAVFCPPDLGLPADGILAQGETDQVGWTFAELDLARIAAARSEGQVANVAHWSEQHRIGPVVPLDLRGERGDAVP